MLGLFPLMHAAGAHTSCFDFVCFLVAGNRLLSWSLMCELSVEVDKESEGVRPLLLRTGVKEDVQRSDTAIIIIIHRKEQGFGSLWLLTYNSDPPFTRQTE